MPANMSTTDVITALGAVITAFGVIVAALTLIEARLRYQQESLQQQAARTREDLKTIIGSCNRFLHPLSQAVPYPILHTTTAITNEISSRLGPSPRVEDVLALLSNKDLLRSICIEGWIASSHIIHLMSIVEEVERNAHSRHVRGKLLLICSVSFLLAGIVANVCSPDFFYQMISGLKPEEFRHEKVRDYLNALNVGMQKCVCADFSTYYKDAIIQTLYLIQVASNAFVNLKDKDLMRVAETPLRKPSEKALPEAAAASRTLRQTLDELRCNASLPARIEQVRMHLASLVKDIEPADWSDLRNLIESIATNCRLFPESCISSDLDKLGFCVRHYPASETDLLKNYALA